MKAGETKTFTVKEEKEIESSVELTNSSENQLHYFVSLSEASAELKQKLNEALKLKEKWDSSACRELNQVGCGPESSECGLRTVSARKLA